MPKFTVLLYLTLLPTRLWYGGLGIVVIVLGLCAAGLVSFTGAMLIVGVFATVLVSLFFWAGTEEALSRGQDDVRQGYVERFGQDSRQVRLYDEVQRGELRRAFSRVRLWFIVAYAAVFMIAVIVATFMQVLSTAEPPTQAYIATTLSLVLLISLGIIVSRNPNLQLESHTGFIFFALMEPDYGKAVRYADEMVRRQMSDAARLEAAHTYLVAGDIRRAEQQISDMLQTLTAKATPRRRLECQRLSRALTLMSTIRTIGQDFGAAESLLLLAQQNDPMNDLALVNHAQILLLQGRRWQEALDLLAEANQIRRKAKHPRIPNHAMLTAWANRLGGQDDRYEALMMDAFIIADAKQQPSITAAVHYLHGLMRDSMGESELARLAFVEAQKTDPNGLYGQLAAGKLPSTSDDIPA